jgi:hypothetical protein
MDSVQGELQVGNDEPSGNAVSVTLGAIAKNEGKYLVEWIAFHLAIGFDKIVIYSNDTEDNQNDVLAAIAKGEPRLEWINWPSPPGESAQHAAYNDLIRRCETTWVAFLDLDEFVVPLEDRGIRQWLATVPDDVATVHVNWRGFGSSGVTSPDYELVTRTFTMGAPRDWGNHHHFKSFGRVAVAGHALAHNIVATSGRRTLSDFGDFETINHGVANRIAYHRIQINHYQCKTFAEFQARMRKGSATVALDDPRRQRNGSWERFQQLDLNSEPERSIRRFDGAFDETYKRIKKLAAPNI